MAPPLSKAVLKQLDELYYEEQNFFGRDKLWKIAVSKKIPVSRRQVMDWLKLQPLYQKYLPTHKNRVIQPTILSKPQQQLGIDLMDLQNLEYNGYKYVLTIVDLFSKKIWAIPLKNKKDRTVAVAFDRYLKKSKKISSVRSDRGSEFISNEFKRILLKHKVKQILSLPQKPQSNGQVERANKTLKRLINMGVKSTNNNNWISRLKKQVKNYNNSVNDTTGKTPNEVADGKDNSTTKKRITKRVLKGRYRDISKIKLGDTVRIKIKEEEQDRNKQLWSSKVYKVVKVLKPNNSVSSTRYKVGTLSKIFYNQDLQPVIVGYGRKQVEPEKWEVSKILKPTVKQGVKSYFVKWKRQRQPTLEPRKVLLEDVPKLIRLFEKRNKVVWRNNRVSWVKE